MGKYTVTAQAIYPQYEMFGDTVWLAAPEVRKATGSAVTGWETEAETFPTKAAAITAGKALRTAYGPDTADCTMVFRVWPDGTLLDGGIVARVG